MLRQGRTVRTLILPYADRARPDRLYMPRFVYSILGSPQWVVGDYLVNPPPTAPRAPVLQQARDKGTDEAAEPTEAGAPPTIAAEKLP
jgi:conjugal transfer pilus assembly protein TraV